MASEIQSASDTLTVTVGRAWYNSYLDFVMVDYIIIGLLVAAPFAYWFLKKWHRGRQFDSLYESMREPQKEAIQ